MPPLFGSLTLAPSIADVGEVFSRYELPTIILSVHRVEAKDFLLLLAPPHRHHAILVSGFRFGKVPDVKLVLDVLLHVAHSEVEPLLMPNSIGINIHEQVILLRFFMPILEHLLKVATLEMAINKKSIRLHYIRFLLFEIGSVLLIILYTYESVRVDSLSR